ncbi:MAG TPA: hypothetical protein VFR07_03740 [Mycobacteriales bacterium]|jgi:hypothetical protein|nr:hypothetical protein [Mycobacteriales bacterium]
MPNEVNGLPTHVLLVHGVVVLVPLCALLLVAAAVAPRARARLGGFLPLLAAGCLVMVPLTTSAGEWLEQRVGGGPLVERHAALGDGLLPWVIGLLVLSTAVWWRGRQAATAAGPAPASRRVATGSRGAASPGVLVQVALAALSVAVAVGAVVQVVRIGDSGAKAVWTGVTGSA